MGLSKGKPTTKTGLEGTVPPFWVPETFGVTVCLYFWTFIGVPLGNS